MGFLSGFSKVGFVENYGLKLLKKFSSFQFKDDLFGIINKALVDVINNELKKCTVDEIVNGNCKPKELMMFLKK